MGFKIGDKVLIKEIYYRSGNKVTRPVPRNNKGLRYQHEWKDKKTPLIVYDILREVEGGECYNVYNCSPKGTYAPTDIFIEAELMPYSSINWRKRLC